MKKVFNKLITILVCFSLFFTMFTPIKAFVSGGQTLSFLVPVLLIFFVDKLYKRKHVYGALFVVAIITLLHFIGVGYFENYLPECLYLLFGVFAFEHYFINKDKGYAKCVLITEFATLFFLIVLSIPQFILEPNLTRMLNVAAEDPTTEFNYYWCISYRTVHELPTLSIPFFALYNSTKQKITKIVAVLCLALMFVVMIYASSTTSLLLLVSIYIFFLIYNQKKTLNQNILRLGLVAILILPFMSKSFVVGIIDNVIQPVFEGSSTSRRIDDIKYYILTGETEGDIGKRDDVYNISMDSFLSNPLFPEFDNNRIGRHSHLLDHLCAMGLLFFIPYMVFLYNRFKRPLYYIPYGKPYYIIAVGTFLIMAALKNFFVFTPAMFIVPLLLIQIENLKRKTT